MTGQGEGQEHCSPGRKGLGDSLSGGLSWCSWSWPSPFLDLCRVEREVGGQRLQVGKVSWGAEVGGLRPEADPTHTHAPGQQGFSEHEQA